MNIISYASTRDWLDPEQRRTCRSFGSTSGVVTSLKIFGTSTFLPWDELTWVPMINPTSNSGKEADELFDVLSSDRRRYVIQVLEETSGSIDLHTLARQVAAREISAPPGEVPDDRTETVATSLYHLHLPKLSDIEVIEYDAEANCVRGPLD